MKIKRPAQGKEIIKHVIAKRTTKKAPAAPQVDEVAEVDDFDTSSRFVMRFEVFPEPGMSQRDTIERFQKFFDFYHPTFGVKITKE